MPREKPPENEVGAPGLAGGPGPTPPGIDDGTPHPTLGAGAPAQSAEEQGDESRTAERTAGTRADEVPGSGRRGDPEEESGARGRTARGEPGAGEHGSRRTRRRGRRGGGEPG